MQRTLTSLLGALLCLLFAVGVTGCGDDEHEGFTSDQCRLSPRDCDEGGTGGLCNRDDDCKSGFCCRDNGNCGEGMCTFTCKHNEDCPHGMLCEHDLCFYACDHDEDCGPGMGCEHGNTVCEWK